MEQLIEDIYHDKNKKHLKRKSYYVIHNGEKLLHREDGPAQIYTTKASIVYAENYYIMGKEHRDDAPASVFYVTSGTYRYLDTEIWFKDGEYHREGDLPAIIEYNTSGTILLQKWFKNGNLHRDNGLPALIEYDSKNNLHVEEWYVNGMQHRENGPAMITYDVDLNYACYFIYYKNDMRHREDGPAYIRINKDNSFIERMWYINGEKHRIEGPAEIMNGFAWGIDSTTYRYYYKDNKIKFTDLKQTSEYQEYKMNQLLKKALKK